MVELAMVAVVWWQKCAASGTDSENMDFQCIERNQVHSIGVKHATYDQNENQSAASRLRISVRSHSLLCDDDDDDDMLS